MSTRYHATYTKQDLDAIDAEHVAWQRQIHDRTPRLEALCDALTERERDLYEGGRVIQAGELFLALEDLRRGLGHARYEVSAAEDAAIRKRWGAVVATDQERAS